MRGLKRSVVLVRKEVQGFVLNRLQAALLREAWALVEEGVASCEDIDRTVRDGLGWRWSFMGPFETIELNAPGGVADYCARYSSFYRRLAADPPGPDVWEGASAARVVGTLGAPLNAAEREQRTRRRDRRLLALRRHKTASSKTD